MSRGRVWGQWPEATVLVDPSRSTCNYCGFGCDPFNETSHETIREYGSNNGEPGCGIIWKYSASNYVGLDMKSSITKQLPHLEWVGWEDKEWQESCKRATQETKTQ